MVAKLGGEAEWCAGSATLVDEAKWCAGSASGMRGLGRRAEAGKGAREHSEGSCRSDGMRAVDGTGGDAERAGVAVDMARIAAEEAKWAQRARDSGGAMWTDMGGGAVTGGLGAVDEAGEAGEATEGAGEGMKGARSACESAGSGCATGVTCCTWAVTDGASDVRCGAMGDTMSACGNSGMQATRMETEGPMAKSTEGVALEDDMDGADGANGV